MVSSLRVETMSTKEVRGCAGDIGVDNIGNGPGKDGRVRGIYLIGTAIRVGRRKRESALVRVRVTVTTIDQFTLTRKPGTALNRLSKVGGSRRPSWEKIGTMRRNANSSGRPALLVHASSSSEKTTMLLLPPPWISRTEVAASNFMSREATPCSLERTTMPLIRLPLW